jgi:hypothetical protein
MLNCLIGVFLITAPLLMELTWMGKELLVVIYVDVQEVITMRM